MARIDRSIGSIRRISRRMALSRVRSGKPVRNTSVIGETIARKASASSSTRMAISMRACGLLTSATVRELTGRTQQATNCAVNTQEIGMRTRNMEEAPFSTRMETDTMGTGSMGCLRGRAV